MSELQLWRVRVTQTREVTGEALVWAESRARAMEMAEIEVELDDVIDPIEDTSCHARRAEFTELDSIKPGNEWLVMPDGSGTDDIDEFRSVLTPEMQFVLQQREWERNGQLALEVRS